jgi:hypothetical protein
MSANGVSANPRKPLSRLALILPIAATFAFSLLDAHPCQARLHSGMAHIHWDAVWDFSDSSVTFLPNGDLYWVETTALLHQASQGSEQMWFTANEPAVMTIGSIDSTYGELTSAPVDVGQYVDFLVASPDIVYVLRTVEGNYVKFRIHAFVGGGITVEFTYQDNGSRVLAQSMATGLTTWGRIKGLYR